MRLLLTGRNVDITPPLRQQVTRQLARLERVLQDSAVSAQVVLSRERHRHLTDIALHARGDNVLAGVGTTTTWPLSIKDAIGKIELQAKRVKGKWTTRKRHALGPRQVGAVLAETAPPPAAEPAPPDVPKVVRTRYSIRAMSLDEAAERFAAGDEPFVLFRDRVAGKVMMVFRRKDGQLGFLEPQA
jgi:putative sigma-54 modulation protein